MSGARISLLVGLVVVSVSASIGAAIGSIAGLLRRRVDEAISRLIDILLAFPGLLLAIALVAVLGPSLTNVVLALSLIGWVGYARLVRGAGAAGARIRVRAGGAGARRGDAANPDPSHPASRAARPHRSGDARHGWSDPRPRPR